MDIKGSTLPEAFFNRYRRDPEGKLFFVKENGTWNPTTYGQAFETVLKTIAGLKRLGFKRESIGVIFSENRREWILTDYAIHWLGGATAAIYTTSTPEQIEYILNESEAEVLFVSNSKLAQMLGSIPKLKHLKYVVAWESIHAPKLPEGVQLITREAFLKDQISVKEAENLLKSLKPEDLAILLYTSGTTGEPKGVMLTHRNVVENLKQMREAFPFVTSNHLTISFLPLSHIYERTLHNLFIMVGLQIYFAESMEKIIENIAEVRPQVMTAVPRIFEKMYVKIMERMRNAPPLRKKIFAYALGIGAAAFPYRYANRPLPLSLKLMYAAADFLVFRKIRAITGGRAEIFISGGAPLSQDIAEFFFKAGFTILEGYGLSETCILSVNLPGKVKFGSVGFPFRETEIKIAPDGEILVRGPQVMKGYFKKEDETTNVLTSDGWFHTGDIGEIDGSGYLKITDRKKELIATAGGKKIAPQPIENRLKQDALVETVCVVGDKRPYAVALIVPNLELCRTWAQSKGIKCETLSDCARSPELKEHFQKLIETVNSGLPSYSSIKSFALLKRPFTQETGELTPTLKLKRRVIHENFSDDIEAVYKTAAKTYGREDVSTYSG